MSACGLVTTFFISRGAPPPLADASHASRSRARMLAWPQALILALCVARPAAAQETHLLVITGVEGDQEHSQLFHTLATTLIDAARKQYAELSQEATGIQLHKLLTPGQLVEDLKKGAPGEKRPEHYRPS